MTQRLRIEKIGVRRGLALQSGAFAQNRQMTTRRNLLAQVAQFPPLNNIVGLIVCLIGKVWFPFLISC